MTDQMLASAQDPFGELPALIPIPKAAELLGISRTCAYRLANAGELPARRLGGRVFAITSRLHDFVHNPDEAA
ncbi:MAG: helix-turn-helix domain-containing protein [Nocardioides sp.]